MAGVGVVAGSRLDDPVRVGRYRVVGRLREDGLGTVYLARSVRGEQVAARVIAPAFAARPRVRERLAREIGNAAAVSSPYVAKVVDADIGGTQPWTAAEYVPGPTMELLVAQQGPLVPARLLAVAAALAAGLRDIHQAGLSHRGLQPSTVIFAPDRPRIADLGAVVSGLDALAATGRLIGSPGYLSPEQADLDEVGPASDIFSLGSVLAFAATGDGPFGAGRPPDLLSRIVDDAPDLAGVPPPVRPLISWCLAKDPGERPSAAAVLDRVYEIAALEASLDAAGLDGLMAGIAPREAAAPDAAGEGAAGPFPVPLPVAGQSSLAPVAGAAFTGPGHHEPGQGRAYSAPAAPRGAATAGPAYDHAEDTSRFRFLTGVMPERAPVSARIGLLVRITLIALPGSAPPKEPGIPPSGTTVTITVSAPGLVALGDLEQDLAVPFADDSEPVLFGFMAARAGLHWVDVRAYAGGTFLGELALQVSVETGAQLAEGRSRVAVLTGLASEPGEVTLQVSRTVGGYSFQLLSDAPYPVVLTDRLAGDPARVVAKIAAELKAMARSQSPYAAPAHARNRLRALGTELWADVVPEAVRRQFWAQRDRIELLTIASDMDTVPWELIYPVDLANENGFLVEQFPVVRRVFGQGRTRSLRLDSGAAYLVPPRSPADALDEVRTLRGILPANVTDRGVREGLTDVFELLDAMPSVLHFAGHDAFTDEAGPVINLDGGPLRPDDLAYARQKRAFSAISPLVFFNGCRTAGEIAGFTQMNGWAEKFMSAGAGAFIGSLWAVRSSSARLFAEEFYRSLIQGRQPLGIASLRARQAIAADSGDPTWLAYTVYGNPSARVDRDPFLPQGNQ